MKPSMERTGLERKMLADTVLVFKGFSDKDEAPKDASAPKAKAKAKVVAEDELVQSFFAKAHGGSYDPNSRVDKAKMQKILGMVNAQPDLLSLTPGKFAVKLYASK